MTRVSISTDVVPFCGRFVEVLTQRAMILPTTQVARREKTSLAYALIDLGKLVNP